LQGSRKADARPCLPFISIVTDEAACAEFLAVAVALLTTLEHEPAKLARRLCDLERVALYFVLQSRAVIVTKRHARARAMLDSMRDESETPDAYSLSADEKRSCIERLNGSFESTKEVRAAKAVLLKLNAHALWSASESTVEAQWELEHVMPKKLTAKWKEDWPDLKKCEEWQHVLGNFAIVNATMNKKMGNQGFALKQEKFLESAFPLTQKIGREHTKWGEEDVRENQERLVALAIEVFRLE
jgi:hypothetical protein